MTAEEALERVAKRWALTAGCARTNEKAVGFFARAFCEELGVTAEERCKCEAHDGPCSYCIKNLEAVSLLLEMADG